MGVESIRGGRLATMRTLPPSPPAPPPPGPLGLPRWLPSPHPALPATTRETTARSNDVRCALILDLLAPRGRVDRKSMRRMEHIKDPACEEAWAIAHGWTGGARVDIVRRVSRVAAPVGARWPSLPRTGD